MISSKDKKVTLSFIKSLGGRLQKENVFVVTAESCTGGMIAEALTSVENSSSWFDRSFITYSNEAKNSMLGVRKDTLDKYGAVSENCVREMALGAIEKSLCPCTSKASTGSTIASIAVSGIAGPGGGTKKKPVGTVWIAWGLYSITKSYCSQDVEITTDCFQFSGSRTSVREQITLHALQRLMSLR